MCGDGETNEKKNPSTLSTATSNININIRTEKEKLRKSAFVAQKPQNLFMLVKQKTYTRDTCKVMFILFMCVCGVRNAWQWQKYYKQFLSPMNILHNFHLLDKHSHYTNTHTLAFARTRLTMFHVNVWLFSLAWLGEAGRFRCVAFLVSCGVVETLIWHGWCQTVFGWLFGATAAIHNSEWYFVKCFVSVLTFVVHSSIQPFVFRLY